MDKIKQLVIPSLKFHTGRTIPQIGLGTYQNRGDTCVNSVKVAVKNGYCHIDTASGYQNGHDIARALDDLYNEKIVAREDLFITSKIAPSEQGYDNALKACENILKGLKTSYLDLLIIHWPGATGSVNSQDVPAVRLETWRALEKLKSEGKVKDIGVSNFLERHLEHLLANSETKPVLNQFELHPLCHNKQLVEYCKKRDIVVEAYSSLARMDPILMKNEYLELVGKKYGKTVAQVALRWGLQNGFVILPKSKTEKYIVDNIRILDFELSEQEMEKMNSMNGDYHTCWNPETVKY